MESVVYSTPMVGGVCNVEHVVHHLHGELHIDEPSAKSASAGASSAPLIVSVSESASVVHCDEDLMRVAVPGAELESVVMPHAPSTFSLDVPATLIGGHRPSIRVQALIDENDNGECDEGEPFAVAELTDAELGDLALELARDHGCPEPL